MKRNWHWNLTSSNTLQIFNGNTLYWEVDNCSNYTKDKLKKLVESILNEYGFKTNKY